MMGTEQVKKLDKVFKVPDRVRKLQVTNEEELSRAREALVWIAKMIKEVKTTFDPIISRAHAAWKAALDQRRRYEAPLRESEKIVKAAVALYMLKIEEARKEAERKRLEAEREKEELLRKAAQAEEAGDATEADAALTEAIQKEDETRELRLAPEPPKMKNVYTRKTIRFEIIDEAKLPREYLMPDRQKIAAEVRRCGIDTRIPGVRVYSDTTVVTRAD